MLFASQAAAQGLPGSETVILRVDDESIYAHLYKPAKPGGRRPAMVIVHGFDGVSDAREGYWARELGSIGVASLVIESFGARGVGTSIANQAAVSTAQGVRDAYAALGYLAAQDYVDPQRIGILGMSRGGSVALRAADRRKHGEGGAFAAAVALYPGCVAQYRNPQPAAPVQVLIGERDDYASVRNCADYLGRIRHAGGAAQLKVYPGAHHGFDGDTRNERSFFYPQAQNMSDCLLYIEDDGTTTYAKTGERLDSPLKAAEVMRRDCMKSGATIAATAKVKAQAAADVKAFLKTTLLR